MIGFEINFGVFEPEAKYPVSKKTKSKTENSKTKRTRIEKKKEIPKGMFQ